MNRIIRHHIITLICALLVLFAVGMGIIVLSFSMKEREARVLEARDYLASFEQNKRTFTEEAEQLENIRERTDVLEKSLLTKESVPSLLSSLEERAQQYGTALTITSVTEQPAAAGVPQMLHVDFSAEGSFENLEKFLDTFRAQAYQVQFDAVSLFQSGDVWQLLGSITISSFK